MTALLFVALCALIVFAGTNLSRAADKLTSASPGGKTWGGLVLLATVTSLPELFAGLGAVVPLDAPDIAVGGLLGSCMFNLFVVSVLDAFSGSEPVSNRVERGHLLSMGFGLILVSVAGMGLVVPQVAQAVGWMGIYSPVLLLLYLLSTRIAWRWGERNPQQELDLGPGLEPKERKRLWLQYGVNAVCVLAAAGVVPGLAHQIAEASGVSQSFIGNSLVALATSLPELVVALAAVRMGSPDLAFGNILGSNLFNLALIGVLDLVYWRGSLLEAASSGHLVSVFGVVVMTAILTVSVTYRTREKKVLLAWDSWAILATYVGSLGLLALG